jgi:hypothetical protein
LSSRAHQAILPSPLLEPAVQLCQAIGAHGVCRAHSGTLVGLLVDPEQVDVPRALAYVRHLLGPSVSVTRRAMIDGGPRILDLRPTVCGYSDSFARACQRP